MLSEFVRTALTLTKQNVKAKPAFSRGSLVLRFHVNFVALPHGSFKCVLL